MGIQQEQYEFYEFYNIMEKMNHFATLERDPKAFVIFAIQHAVNSEAFRNQYGTYGVELLTDLSK